MLVICWVMPVKYQIHASFMPSLHRSHFSYMPVMWYSYASHIPVICWSHTTHMTAICQSNVYAFYLWALFFCNICQLFLYNSLSWILIITSYTILIQWSIMATTHPILFLPLSHFQSYPHYIWSYSVLCFHIDLIRRISYDMPYSSTCI